MAVKRLFLRSFDDADRVRRSEFLGHSPCEVQFSYVVASKAQGTHQGDEALLVLPKSFAAHVQSSSTALVRALTLKVMNGVESVWRTALAG